MGYDFHLLRLRLRNGLASAPTSIPDDLTEADVVAAPDAASLLAAAQASALFAPGSLALGPTGFRWRPPDGGSLEVIASDPWIRIDTHAHWDHVAQVFDLVVGLWPDTVLLDLQKGTMHSPQSFREFVERSYREKAEWLARRAADAAPRGDGR